jgi:hypothetical protein
MTTAIVADDPTKRESSNSVPGFAFKRSSSRSTAAEACVVRDAPRATQQKISKVKTSALISFGLFLFSCHDEFHNFLHKTGSEVRSAQTLPTRVNGTLQWMESNGACLFRRSMDIDTRFKLHIYRAVSHATHVRICGGLL